MDDIYNKINEDDIVLDYVYQVQEVFKKFDKNFEFEDYPEVLKPFLGRKIWKDTINRIASDETKWSKGNFVKSVKTKIITGKIIDSLESLVGCGTADEDFEVFVSEPLDIVAEYRCFVLNDEILDVRPYGSFREETKEGYLYPYNPDVLKKIIDAYSKYDKKVKACSIDICVTKEGRTLLLECNDAYALGCYGLFPISYARFIATRWQEVMQIENSFSY